MALLDTMQPIIVYTGTVDEVFSHRDEIPTGATLELRVFEQELEKPAVVLDEKAKAALAWLDARITEGKAADEKTRLEADKEVEEFKRCMNANREATSERLVFP